MFKFEQNKEILLKKFASEHHKKEWDRYETKMLLNYRCQITIVIKLLVSSCALFLGKASLTKALHNDESDSEDQARYLSISDWDIYRILASIFYLARLVLFIISFQKIEVCRLYYYNEMVLSSLTALIWQSSLKDADVMAELFMLTNLINFACLYTNYWMGLVCTVVSTIVVLVSRGLIYGDDWSFEMFTVAIFMIAL